MTHNDASQSVGLPWTSDQLVAESSTRQHTTFTTTIHALGGIRTHNLSRRAAADLRLRPRGHWERLILRTEVLNCKPADHSDHVPVSEVSLFGFFPELFNTWQYWWIKLKTVTSSMELLRHTSLSVPHFIVSSLLRTYVLWSLTTQTVLSTSSWDIEVSQHICVLLLRVLQSLAMTESAFQGVTKEINKLKFNSNRRRLIHEGLIK
jgi:hypothetical protein